MHPKGFLLHLYIWLSISGFVLEVRMYGNDQLNACGARGALNRYEAIIVNSRKYPYLPHGRDFLEDPQPLWKFQLSFIHFYILIIELLHNNNSLFHILLEYFQNIVVADNALITFSVIGLPCLQV